MADFVWPPGTPTKRPPCGGWITPFSKAATLGDLHQHYNQTISAIAVRKNQTQVWNPACSPECMVTPTCPPGTPMTVAPTPRDACIDSVSGDATTFNGCVPLCGPEIATYAIGGTYNFGNGAVATLPPVPCSAGTTRIGDNCYADPDPKNTKNFATCRMIGFKNVIAYKQWHGIRPFGVDCFQPDDDTSKCDNPDCPPVNFACVSKPYTPNNGATKKYLSSKLEVAVNILTGNGEAVPNQSEFYNYSCTNSVDSRTGKVTRTCTASAGHGAGTFKDGSTTSGSSETPGPLPDIVNLISRCSKNYGAEVNDCGGYGQGSLDITVTGDYKIQLHFKSPTISWEVWRLNDDPVILTVEPVPYTLDESFDPSFWTDTGLGFQNYTEVTVTWTLGDGLGGGSYSSDDVMADIATLLATWNLTDHAQYPPRTDALTNCGPLVTYNERSEVDLGSVGWIDPSATGFVSGATIEDTSVPQFPSRVEGSIVGAPLPTGAEPYFDFYHKVWDLDDESGVYGYNAPKQYGQISLSAGYYCPHMTMWTDERHQRSLPHGPFIFYPGNPNTGQGGGIGAALFLPHIKPDNTQTIFPTSGVWVSKWAEVLMFEKPPHNYQRPCGAYDAAAIDLTSVICGAADPLASALPRWPNTDCDCDDNTFVGQISAVSNTTPIAVTFKSPVSLADGQVVNICNVKGCTAANGKRTVLVLSADTVQLFDSDDPEKPIAGNGDYTGGGSCSRSTDGSEQVWNDFWNKGNFTFKQFWYDWRDWYESYLGILQSYQRHKANVTNAGTDIGFGPYCEHSDGTQCCPPCPELDSPDPVRFLPDLSQIDGGAIIQEGNERNGGSKWLKNVSCDQYCVIHSPCAPCMAYVQPAAQNVGIGTDNTDKAINMPYFSDTNKLDWNYGTLWIGRVEQWMTDPLWKPFGNGHELLLCNKAGNENCDQLQEDDGILNCHADENGAYLDTGTGKTICLFPQRPYEESECAPPATAPALPAGSRVMGCANYVANLNADPAIVNNQDCAPNIPECGSPYNFFITWNGTNAYNMFAAGPDEMPMCSPFTPWLWLMNQQLSVKTNCIFANDYKRNGAIAE